jgi:hypothetical protein
MTDACSLTPRLPAIKLYIDARSVDPIAGGTAHAPDEAAFVAAS